MQLEQKLTNNTHINKTTKILTYSNVHIQNGSHKLQYMMSNGNILLHTNEQSINKTGKCLQIFAWRMIWLIEEQLTKAEKTDGKKPHQTFIIMNKAWYEH